MNSGDCFQYVSHPCWHVINFSWTKSCIWPHHLYQSQHTCWASEGSIHFTSKGQHGCKGKNKRDCSSSNCLSEKRICTWAKPSKLVGGAWILTVESLTHYGFHLNTITGKSRPKTAKLIKPYWHGTFLNSLSQTWMHVFAHRKILVYSVWSSPELYIDSGLACQTKQALIGK